MGKSKVKKELARLKSELTMYKIISTHKGYRNYYKKGTTPKYVTFLFYDTNTFFKDTVENTINLISDFSDYTQLKCFEGFTTDKKEIYLKAWVEKSIMDIKREIKKLKQIR